jgi:HAE1 family hydrophobic/amphiphilic exporter-1
LEASLTRLDGERSATSSVPPAESDLGQLSGRIQDAVDAVDLPAGATVEVGGITASQSDAFGDLGLALLLAIAIVFIVMVATFGSLLQPFILLISIPFAATGALVALLASGTPLGVPSLIGLLMLVGIVVSNAIVLIDLINQYRRQGRSLDQAIEEGARKRLRPIVMTAAATILALTPMALGLTGGEGSFISGPLALVVIGGLVSSTLLTLIVVPVLYRFEARAHDRRAARQAERHAARVAARVAARESQLQADAAPRPPAGPPLEVGGQEEAGDGEAPDAVGVAAYPGAQRQDVPRAVVAQGQQRGALARRRRAEPPAGDQGVDALARALRHEVDLAFAEFARRYLAAPAAESSPPDDAPQHADHPGVRADEHRADEDRADEAMAPGE